MILVFQSKRRSVRSMVDERTEWAQEQALRDADEAFLLTSVVDPKTGEEVPVKFAAVQEVQQKVEQLLATESPQVPSPEIVDTRSEVRRVIDAQLFWNSIGVDPYEHRYDTPGSGFPGSRDRRDP